MLALQAGMAQLVSIWRHRYSSIGNVAGRPFAVRECGCVQEERTHTTVDSGAGSCQQWLVREDLWLK